MGRETVAGRQSELTLGETTFVLLIFAGLIAAQIAMVVIGVAAASKVAQADGGSTSCAVKADGRLYCWGQNSHGQLGTGSTEPLSTTPELVPLASPAKQVSTRTFHTCAVLVDESIQCWGRNDRGQLGNGTTNDSSTPVRVRSIDDAVSVAAGVFHTCALRSTGGVYCWGYNAYGQVGDGTLDNRADPVRVTGIQDAVAITAGADHSCAILASGRIKCWGWNAQGQIGVGTTLAQYETPQMVVGIDNAVNMSAGDYFTCAVLATGHVKCWGLNGQAYPGQTINSGRAIYSGMLEGSLGNGHFTNSPLPVDVIGIETAVEVEAGYTTACARLSEGRVLCWGRNRRGQLGDGSFYDASSTPVEVAFDDKAKASKLAGSQCAILSSGDLRCWGIGYYGQLGIADRSDSAAPVSIDGL